MENYLFQNHFQIFLFMLELLDCKLAIKNVWTGVKRPKDLFRGHSRLT
jgi:hypothetical protein